MAEKNNRPIIADIKTTMQLFGFGKTKMTQIAHDAGAVMEFNSRCKRYNVARIESYLNSYLEDSGGQKHDL